MRQELGGPDGDHGAGGDFQAERVEGIGLSSHGLHQLQVLHTKGNGKFLVGARQVEHGADVNQKALAFGEVVSRSAVGYEHLALVKGLAIHTGPGPNYQVLL